MNIIREDPPSHGNASHAWEEIANKLRADPGNWYRIFEESTSIQLTTNIKRARLAAFRPEGAFESRSRGNEDGTRTVWARYVGEEGQA